MSTADLVATVFLLAVILFFGLVWVWVSYGEHLEKIQRARIRQKINRNDPATGELIPWLALGGTLSGGNGRKRACGAFSGFGRVFYRSRRDVGFPPVPRGL